MAVDSSLRMAPTSLHVTAMRHPLGHPRVVLARGSVVPMASAQPDGRLDPTVCMSISARAALAGLASLVTIGLGWRRSRSKLPVQAGSRSEDTLDGSPLPPAWVVNLDRSPGRWETCQEEFTREGLQIERFPATDGKTLSHESLRETCTWPARWFCTKGMLGCSISHMRIWSRVVDEQLPAVIVLEDDVRLYPGFHEKLGVILKDLESLDWDVCLLGAVACISPDVEPLPMKFYSFLSGGGRPSPGKTRKVSDHLFVPHRPAGTHAYIVSLSGAAKLKRLLPKARYHVDLSSWALPELNLYCAVEQLATQNFEEASTVSKAGDPLTKRFLEWCWHVAGFKRMLHAAGVTDLNWAWKTAVFALPHPFRRGVRVAVDAGPVTSVWLLAMIFAMVLRSKKLLLAAVTYQALMCFAVRYLCGTWSWRFAGFHLLLFLAILRA